jgi:hypothetical protein
MNRKSLNIIFLILLITSVVLLPVLMGASILDFSEEDNFADQDDFSVVNAFPMSWIRIPVHQMSVLFRLGISIFALFGVYVGGRSKRHLFNDRTIDALSVLKADFLKTARIRAVFNFLFLGLHPQEVLYQQ